MNDATTKRSVLSVVTLTSFLAPFMGSATNVALPSIQKDFHLDAILLAWIATSYLLSSAVLLVPLGKIADIYGRKKVYVYGIYVFAISSFLSAISIDPYMLLASRVLQGVGSGMTFATGMAIITSVFPPLERGRAIGITVGAVYVGLSLGPFVGGMLTQYWTWRSVFGVTVPLGIVAAYVCSRKLKGEWADAQGEELDIIGSILYGVGILLIMLGFSIVPSAKSLWAIVCGVAFIGCFAWWELRARSPVFNIELFTNNRTFALSSLAALINYSATFAITFLLSLYLQYIKGLSPETAGLVLVAQPIVMATFSPLAGKLSDRIEPRKVASLGMGITAAGLLVMSFLDRETSLLFIVLDLLMLGFGFALFSSPNMNAIMSSVDRKFYGIAAGSLASMRLLGQMFSMGIATVVFSIYIGRVQITPERYTAFLESLHTAFIIFAVLCALGVFASLARGELGTNNQSSANVAPGTRT
jgi:EmrB/QacA subfamily drug resistance transporter